MSGEAVKVIVRCRLINEFEQHLQCDIVVSMDTKIMQAQRVKPKADPKITPPKLFTFDGVYGMEDTTQKIYEDICLPLAFRLKCFRRYCNVIVPLCSYTK